MLPRTLNSLPSARDDLESIYSYISDELCKTQGLAKTTIGEILDRISLLARISPIRHSPISIYAVKSEYRYVRSGNYLAFYRVSDAIYIDRILYAKSDYLKKLL